MMRALIVGIIACSALAFQPRTASAEAALLVDVNSGRVLYAQNATQPWYPASVTKIMTAYVTLKAVKEGRISFDTPCTVSDSAVAQAPSKMGFKAGTIVTVDNALKMMLVHSANDMAVVLAECVAGSIDNFANEMNRAAQRLGMTQTSYVNPNGLPDDRQITSARDLAMLTRAALREMPEYDSYWHIPAIRFGRRVMRNYNKLIDRYPGADGMKTGFICASGFNLVATATRGGRRLVAVILGARSGVDRSEKAAQLLERGFTGANAVSWLLPSSLGTVDSLKPIDAAPMDLHDEICNHKGRRRPHSDSEETQAEDGNSPLNAVAGFQLGPPKQGLLGPLQESMPPVQVFVGLVPPKTIELASEPARKKPARKTAHVTPAAAGEMAPKPAAKPATKPRPATASNQPAAARPPATRAAPRVPAAPKSAAIAERAAKPKPKAKPKPVEVPQ